MAADGSAVTVAVDANGADLGPAEVAAGAATAAAQGVRVLLFGPAEAIGDVADGVEVVDAPVSIAKAADPVVAVRSTPDASIVQAARAVADGARRRARRRRLDRRGAGRGPLQHQARARASTGPRWRSRSPCPGTPVTLLDVGANAEVAARAPRPVRVHGRRAGADRARRRARRASALLSNGEEATKGTPLVEAPPHENARRLAACDFVGNVEGFASTRAWPT